MMNQAIKTVIGLTLVLLGHLAQAKVDSSFTSVSAYKDGQFLISTKLMVGGIKASPSLDIWDAESQKATSVELTGDNAEREILAAFVIQDQIYMINQWTSGDGDHPQIHRYDEKSRAWVKLGQIKCQSFDRVSILKNDLKVNCQRYTKGKLESFPVKTNLDALLTNAEMQIEVPQVKVQGSGRFSLELEGEYPEFEKLKVLKDKKVLRTLVPSDLVRK